MTAPDSDDLGNFPNHEELPFALRSVEGSLPSFAPVLPILLFIAIAGVGSPPNTGLIALGGVLAAIFVAGGVYGVVWMRRRTPSSISVGRTGVTGVWSHPTGRQLRVEFDRITSLNPAGWAWIHAGRSVYCRYTPPAISYETMGMPGKPPDHLFVTEPLRQRISRAREAWIEDSRHSPDSPLQSDELTEQEARDLGEV